MRITQTCLLIFYTVLIGLRASYVHAVTRKTTNSKANDLYSFIQSPPAGILVDDYYAHVMPVLLKLYSQNHASKKVRELTELLYRTVTDETGFISYVSPLMYLDLHPEYDLLRELFEQYERTIIITDHSNNDIERY